MDEDRPIPAKSAARLMGKPEMARTFMRRAAETVRKGDDPRVYQVGRMYFAPLSYWRTITLRPVGRKPGPRQRTPRRLAPFDDEPAPRVAAPYPSRAYESLR